MCFVAAPAGPIASAQTAIADRLADALAPVSGAKTGVGVHIVDLSDGSTIYERNATTPMMPASCMKLAVMAAAVDHLGPDYSFTTVLAVRGSDLVVIGSGDPTFGDEKLAEAREQEIGAAFKQWATRLRAEGVKQIPGNIIVDDFIFDLDFVHPNWPKDQYQAWYEAPIGGLNFNANCVAAVVAPTTPGQPARVSLIPPNEYMGISNETRTGGDMTVTVHRQRDSDTLMLRGNVSKDGQLEVVTVRDPGLFFGAALKSAIEAEGIPVGGKVLREKVRLDANTLPPDVHVVAIHNASIADAMARAGTDSLGMMAEGLFKAMGAKVGGVGSWESGQSAMNAYYRKLGISANQVSVDDGSGLSRENRISPAAMTRILSTVFRDEKTFHLLRSSLGVSGESGTLRKRMRSGNAKGRVFGKTGTIRGVRTLAGYIHAKNDQWYAFAFFYNNITKPDTNPKPKMDRACELLVNYVGDKPAAAARAEAESE
ncbi:MAG: D-alanyl-D-alanine carboxypeptidase/D-alanyl-D-alanine-endopeptidase [Phycisphaerales bacterium]|nr:D-alanyl-D-alanine carboxypeptidase/D-alanyl-D-alanine-endopeptidase [Phycisphaerales bacterium]MCB9863669.1 D-alanyl-D-alanine carboxypeptidase/D-alanyl-D-alanine-endopeptidase [Phycisphaerales bacterium]